MLAFLDLEGVTNNCFSNSRFSSENIDALSSVVKKHNLKIVISSSLRHIYRLDEIKAFLNEIDQYIIGKTPMVDFNNRDAECLAYIEQNQINDSYFAIDDNKDIFNKVPLFKVNGVYGFTADDISNFDRFIEDLKGRNNE